MMVSGDSVGPTMSDDTMKEEVRAEEIDEVELNELKNIETERKRRFTTL